IVSLNWLGRFVDFSEIDPRQLALRFTMASAEVESVKLPPDLEFQNQFVVAEIVETAKHPQADKLTLCKVNDGERILDIVCGAPNARAGLHTILAPVGAKLPGMEIKKAKIRGAESFGMLCSMVELGMGEEGEGIVEITGHPAGTRAGKVFAGRGVTWEVDNKSITHRPDLWGAYGMARELAGVLAKPCRELELAELAENLGDDGFVIEIEEPELCRRYCGLSLGGIEIRPSPKWLQDLLLEVGQKPINNVVDASNFAMLETGEPNHAFDVRRLHGKRIRVARAKAGTEFEAVIGRKVALRESDLVIYDGDRVVALAGVVGGLHSSIAFDTSEVFLEAAHFDAASIRRSAAAHDLRTDSSARFEKSLDPELAPLALRRIVAILRESCPALVVRSRIIDIYPGPYPQRTVTISGDEIRCNLGCEIPDEIQKDILKRLGFSLREEDGGWQVGVPSWRNTKDIEDPIDLVEEVGRVFGYDNIPPRAPVLGVAPVRRSESHRADRALRRFLVARGYDEVRSNSFADSTRYKTLGLCTDSLVELANPVGKEFSHMRDTLLPGMLDIWALNAKNFDHFACFELGRVFDGREGELLPRERDELLCALYGPDEEGSLFYRLRADLLSLMKILTGKEAELVPAEGPHALAHPARCGELRSKGELVGVMAELHPTTARSLALRQRLVYFRLFAPTALTHDAGQGYRAISRHPSVSYRLSLLVPERTPAGEIVNLLREVEPSMISGVEWVGNYRGEAIAEGKVSMTFAMSFRHPERTMEGEEISRLQDRLVAAAAARGFHLRAK
ncbi:MAG: phenylalanine--tRNA ligase subunit beta, partial [Planctomycetes bacterium]|nr:phenylalanine--tRNA ligase subunit beta [Planctomycetota bacterium]